MFNPTVDKPGIVTGIAEFLLGCIFFPLVCYSIQRFFRNTSVGIHLCEHFSISNNGIHDISNKLTSSTFAVLACSTGVFVMRQCNNDILAHRFYVLDNYLIFGVSYFFYDVGSMYMVYSTMEKEEVSISAKEFFKFLRERPLIIFPMLFWWYSSMTGLSLITTFFSLPLWVHLGVLGLWTPQLMWFNKMLRGSVKVIMEQMGRMEGKKKEMKETKIDVNDAVIKSDAVVKSEASKDSDGQLRQKLD